MRYAAIARSFAWACSGVLLAMLAGCASASPQVSETARAPTVMVLGANGKLGSETVKALLRRGYTVSAFVRPTSDRKRLEGLNLAYVEGDLTNDSDVKRAFAERTYEAVIDCAARREGSDPFYDAIMKSVVRWGKASGLKQIILHSSVGVGESAEIPEVADMIATLKGEKRRAYESTFAEKAAAERILEKSGLEYTVIRNWLLMFEGTPATGRGRLTENLRELGRITRPDLAELAVNCIANVECKNKRFNALDDSITPH